jgi:ABC transport system ATP-binding/permease protein
MRLRIVAPDGARSELVVGGAVARCGRDPACEVHFDPAVYPKVSGLHARLERGPAGLVLTPLSQSNKTLLNDQPIDGPVKVKVGDRVRLGFTGPIVEIAHLEVPVASVPVEDSGATAQAEPEMLALLKGTATAPERFAVGAGGVIGRDQGNAAFFLDHAQVSRRHAQLTRAQPNRLMLADLRSANGTYVNGQLIGRPVELKPGDRIDIGPFSLSFDGEALINRSRSNNIELIARGVQRTVKNRATGQPLALLDGIDLVVRPREFACILGPSGSGKSTLLAILSGRNAPNDGAVTVNGEDLYANFAALKHDIAVVAQRDVLHDGLAVGDGLCFTGQLRLPPDTGPDEIAANVDDILNLVGLSARKQTLLRHLSGGQVKRASLANELISRPSMLFLDEVTSGLDEQTDLEMMELFRKVADAGKTVVCITHSLANVEATCTLVVILTEGGRMAFVGTPEEAKRYFGIARLGAVYRKLAERTPEDWQAAFRRSPFFNRYVRDRLPRDSAPSQKIRAIQQSQTSPLAACFRQAGILIRRYAAIWKGDRFALLTMLGQSVLVSALLGIVFGNLTEAANAAERSQRTVNLLFLLNVVCFWLGCNNAAKEMVKERIIYARERNFNLRIDSYYFSKFLVLTAIVLLQVGVLFGVVRWWCAPSGLLVGQALALTSLAIAGTTLGLLISTVSRSEEMAIALVPIAVIPQIILAGAIARLRGLGKGLAQMFVTSYWGEGALESLLPDDLLQISRPEASSHFWEIGVVFVHALLFAALTPIVLRLKDRQSQPT